jgi:O-methyltransferase involved in polyketide biosynthesis
MIPDLNAVSETALLTLRARVNASEEPDPLLSDPMGRKILDAILSNASPKQADRLFRKKIPTTAANYLVLRARKYDAYARSFLERPNSLIMNLGCGFDTRYWRNAEEKVVQLFKKLAEVFSGS